MIRTYNCLEDVYNYWFKSRLTNIEYYRFWIPINNTQKIKLLNEIEKKFGKLIFQIIRSTKNITFTTESINLLKYSFTLKNKISIIIVLDQFVRTLLKNEKYDNLKKIKNHITKVSSYFSLSIIYSIMENEYTDISGNELIFILMPFKHLDIYKYYTLIYNVIQKYLKFTNSILINKSNENLQRFFIDCTQKYYLDNQQSLNIINNYSYMYNNSELKSVCEYIPDNFIEYTYIDNTSESIIKIQNELFNVINNLISNSFIKLNNICVSLSGGVDSMVLTHALSNLQKRIPFSLSAFHLNYNNRKESVIEKEMIIRYCEKLGVKLYTFDIIHIKRRDVNRLDYETLTHNIRFFCYRMIGYPIVLGHIFEDGIENIFTNISTNKHMFNLKKIDVYSLNEGVDILRPFINIKKQDIYDYAEYVGIPHTLNSTPEWSNRGKFRTKFIKSYNEQYGDIGINNLSSFADTLKQYGDIIMKLIIEPKVKSLLSKECIYFTDDEIGMPHIIREIFKIYCHKIGYSMPSEKAIINLVDRINDSKQKNRKMKYNLNGYISLMIDSYTITLL